jgi:hypothetical protein
MWFQISDGIVSDNDGKPLLASEARAALRLTRSSASEARAALGLKRYIAPEIGLLHRPLPKAKKTKIIEPRVKIPKVVEPRPAVPVPEEPRVVPPRLSAPKVVAPRLMGNQTATSESMNSMSQSRKQVFEGKELEFDQGDDSKIVRGNPSPDISAIKETEGLCLLKENIRLKEELRKIEEAELQESIRRLEEDNALYRQLAHEGISSSFPELFEIPPVPEMPSFSEIFDTCAREGVELP